MTRYLEDTWPFTLRYLVKTGWIEVIDRRERKVVAYFSRQTSSKAICDRVNDMNEEAEIERGIQFNGEQIILRELSEQEKESVWHMQGWC